MNRVVTRLGILSVTLTVMCFISMNVSQARIAPEDIVAMWLFDEVEKDVTKDLSVNLHHAELVGNPELVEGACRKYGEQIAVGIDAKDELVATEGWLNVSHKPAIEFAREMQNLGVLTIIYTDIKSDGMLKGPNMEATRAVVEEVEVGVIASGGITSVEDLKTLKSIGASGAIIGRALYTGDLDLQSALAAARPC